jgi:rare lipoprotein A
MYRVILTALGISLLTTLQFLGAPAAKAGGMASFYGYDFAGRLTANGERYNPMGMTAASKTLPFGTIVRVTNRNNGRSVVVRINDRGPYVGGRVIDLSLGAARVVGMIGSGVAPIEMAIIGRGSRTMVASNAHKHRAKVVQVAARAKHKSKAITFARAKSKKTVLASLKLRKHKAAIRLASKSKKKLVTTTIAKTPNANGAPAN